MWMIALFMIISALLGIFLFQCSLVTGIAAIICGLFLLIEQIVLKRRLKRAVHIFICCAASFAGIFCLMFMGMKEQGDDIDSYRASLQRAESLAEAGNTDRAMEILAGLEEEYGTDDKIRLIYTEIYVQEDDQQKALSSIEKCADRTTEEYYVLKEKVYMMSDEEERAEKLYELYVSAAEDQPFWEYAQRMAGIARFEQNNLVSAEYYLLRAKKLDEENPQTLYYLGAVKFKQKEYETGESYFNEALRLGADEEIQSYILWYLEQRDLEIEELEEGGEN